MTAAEADYRRGFHDGESGRRQASGSDSYAAGWRIGATFAKDGPSAPEPPAPAEPVPRTVDIADVVAEIPTRLWTP